MLTGWIRSPCCQRSRTWAVSCRPRYLVGCRPAELSEGIGTDPGRAERGASGRGRPYAASCRQLIDDQHTRRRAGVAPCVSAFPDRSSEMLEGYGGQLALVDVSGRAHARSTSGCSNLISKHLAPGDWVLIHMGFALDRIDEAEAREALAGLELMGRPQQ